MFRTLLSVDRARPHGSLSMLACSKSGIRNRSHQTALPSATQKQRRFDGETDDKFKSFFPIRPRDSFRFADQLWELSCGQGLCRGMDI